jgi:APA family basic amino acid/polyamine antiporter
MAFWNRRKPIDTAAHFDSHTRLKPTLSWPHLVAMGVGAIVGTGIYTLTGIGAGLAGPAVILSFLGCGVLCACAAFCYTEMATMIPASGSAYTYSYVVLGEAVAWIVGWSLILEYTVAASAVAVGWSSHVAVLIQSAGLPVPDALLHGVMSGGIVDIPAILISLFVALLLIAGTRESATLNIVLVIIKVSALVLFVWLAFQSFDVARFHPFAPFGYGAHPDHHGHNYGALGAAAILFFAFYGFDAVSTAAEETKDPGRNLKIGIIGSMLICTTLYVVVAAAALGAVSYVLFSEAHNDTPLVFILKLLDYPVAAQLIAAAVTVALPTVILVLMYGQSRIFFVMARDGLLPQSLSTVHKTRGTPILMTAVTGIVVAAMASTLRLDEIALLANAGTLCAFVSVAVCMLVLRVRAPEQNRPFRAPMAWIVGPICILGCLYLFLNGLPTFTQWWFLLWNGAGLLVYFLYGARSSNLAQTPGA